MKRFLYRYPILGASLAVSCFVALIVLGGILADFLAAKGPASILVVGAAAFVAVMAVAGNELLS